MSQPEPVSTLWSLITHRRVKVDKDGARDVFALVGFSKKSLIRAALAISLSIIGIYMALGRQALLQQITISSSSG